MSRKEDIDVSKEFISKLSPNLTDEKIDKFVVFGNDWYFWNPFTFSDIMETTSSGIDDFWPAHYEVQEQIELNTEHGEQDYRFAGSYSEHYGPIEIYSDKDPEDKDIQYILQKLENSKYPYIVWNSGGDQILFEISNNDVREVWNSWDGEYPPEEYRSIYASILSPVRESLDEKIWDADQLKPEVSEFCFGRVEELLNSFMASEEIPVLLRRVILIGSITGYQYDEDADLDINILVDLDTLADNLGLEKELLIYEMRGAVGKINGEIYPGTSHPVNLFLSTEEGYPPADGIYDMMTDEWVKKPGHPGDIDPYSNLKDAIDRAEQLAEKIDAKWGAAQRTKAEIDRYPQSAPQIKRQYIRYLKSLKRILDNVVNERREVMELARKQNMDPPQASVPNVVYKYLEYNGLMDHLHEAAKTLKRFEENGSFDEPEIPSNAPISFTEPLPAQNEDTPLVIQLGGLRKDSDAYAEPFLILVSPEGNVTWGTRNVEGNHEKLIANAVLEETGQSIVNWQMDAYEGDDEAQEYLDKFEYYARGEFNYSTGPQGELEPTGFFLGYTMDQARTAYEIFKNVPPETAFTWEIEEGIEFNSGTVSQFLGEVSGQPV